MVYTSVYNFIKKLYFDYYDFIKDDGGDEVVEGWITTHETRKKDIIKVVKEYVECEDVVDYVFAKYL